MNNIPYVSDCERGCRKRQTERQGWDIAACPDCCKLAATDWLGDIPPANDRKDIFEIRFKNTHKGFYQNVNNLLLSVGDVVAVEASSGHDIGIVSLFGTTVWRQMARQRIKPDTYEFKKIYRKAKPHDIEKWQEAVAREHSTMIKSRQMAADLRLNMKIGDVEFQGDGSKAIFYYIADERVDFRELIKRFAEEFHIRIEMRQIGARQEAGHIGGLGMCGRELCCSQWMAGFSTVNTTAARWQDLSLNPQKLTGQCGKLKCCLNYEAAVYADAQKGFPKVHAPLNAEDGQWFFTKNDVLAGIMYFADSPERADKVIDLPVDKVKEIIALNKKGEVAPPLSNQGFAATSRQMEVSHDFKSAVGEDSITRFDRKRKSRNQRNKPRRSGGNPPAENRAAAAGKPAPAGAGSAPGNRPHNKSRNNKHPRSRKPEAGKSPKNNGTPPVVS